MEKSTTPAGVRVTGQRRATDEPALRRLARACIGLARWQREQQAAKSDADTATPVEQPRPEGAA